MFNRKKQLLVSVLIFVMIASAGCVRVNVQPEAESEAEAETQTEAQSAKEETPEADGESGPIYYAYQDHPLELYMGDDLMADYDYVSIELQNHESSLYPKLQDWISDFNGKRANDMERSLKEADEEIFDMWNEGMTLGYECDEELYPERADEQAFSFAVGTYLYLGGAHGTQSYECYNIDPKTGKEIAFSDVVKKPGLLPKIMMDELVVQFDYLEEYFELCPTDRENLLNEEFPRRLANNGKDLDWALTDDGISIYFEDYVMGSYAAGAVQGLKISAADHPEVFKDTYFSVDRTAEGIDKQAKKLSDAKAVRLESEYGLEEDYGEDWWYDITVANPGWTSYVKDSVDPDPCKPCLQLKEIGKDVRDWYSEDAWMENYGVSLPEGLPYSDENYDYNDYLLYDHDMFLSVYDLQNEMMIGGFNFDEFSMPPGRDNNDIFGSVADPKILYAKAYDGILYVSIGHRTYSSASPHTSYLLGVDMGSGEVLFKSEDCICGSRNFLIDGDSIICGYGFTDEPDYIYILNRYNGQVQDKLKVRSAPYYFVRKGDDLYVLTYNTAYTYKILGEENPGQ